MIASKGLRPGPLLFFASSGVSTTASISARKALPTEPAPVIASPADHPSPINAASRLSRVEKSQLPHRSLRPNHVPHERDFTQHENGRAIIRGAHLVCIASAILMIVTVYQSQWMTFVEH